MKNFNDLIKWGRRAEFLISTEERIRTYFVLLENFIYLIMVTEELQLKCLSSNYHTKMY